MTEIEPSHNAIDPLLRAFGVPIEYQLSQYGGAEQCSALRNYIEIRDVNVALVPRPGVQQSARDGTMAQYPSLTGSPR